MIRSIKEVMTLKTCSGKTQSNRFNTHTAQHLVGLAMP